MELWECRVPSNRSRGLGPWPVDTAIGRDRPPLREPHQRKGLMFFGSGFDYTFGAPPADVDNPLCYRYTMVYPIRPSQDDCGIRALCRPAAVAKTGNI